MRLPYSSENQYPESQRWWIFIVLMFVGGFFGAFTYTIRGGVFCNAQTANFVLFAMAIGDAHWAKHCIILFQSALIFWELFYLKWHFHPYTGSIPFGGRLF